MEMSWCSEHGLPHSAILNWSKQDRAKLIGYLLEESQRCTMCGTKSWEWEENKRAYMPTEKYCHGCYLKHMSSEDNDSLPGTTIDLVPYDAALVEAQRLRYEQAIMSRESSGDGGKRTVRGQSHS